jgi:serine/threonine protein kinase
MAGTFTNQLQPGTKVGKYQIVSLVATGGMAMLYKAYDKTLDRYVAVKQIAPNLAADPKFVERFRREAQVLARVSQGQQNVVAVYELVEEGGGLFMIMEFVEGASLQNLLDRGAASLQTGLGILLKVALGLKAIHGQGLVHRDLKPDNIMVQPSGSVKIADFGLIGRAGGRTSLPMGTTQYMAPELFAGGAVDGRADIYSMGFIAYQMFVGPEKFRELFADVLADPQSANIRWMHWHVNPQLRAASLREAQPGVPPLVARIVERMMEKDPTRRFNNIDQIIKWLRQIFVMYVQGQSLSEQDSARLEQEVDQEIDGQPAAARAAVAARRDDAALVATPTGAAEPQQPLKTAPLKRRPWHWQDYAKWGGIAVGVVILTIVGFAIRDNMKHNDLVAAAESYMKAGRSAFEEGRWADADREFRAVEDNFRQVLPDTADVAHIWSLRAQINRVIDEKNWTDASNKNEALKKYVEKWPEDRKRQQVMAYVDENFRRILNKKEASDLRRQIDDLKSPSRKDFLTAERLLDRLIEISAPSEKDALEKEREELRVSQKKSDAQKILAEGDKRAGDGTNRKLLAEALQLYVQADKQFSSDESRGRIKDVGTATAILNLQESLNKSMADKNWKEAADDCQQIAEKVKELKGSLFRVIDPTLLAKRSDEVRCNFMFQIARSLGDDDPKKLEHLGEILKINPAHSEALAERTRILNRKTMVELKSDADKAEREGRFDDAISVLEQMKDKETDDSVRKEYQDRITRIKQRRAIKNFDQAISTRNWEAAKAALDDFGQADGPPGELQARESRLRNLSLYWEHFDKGTELQKQGGFSQAIESFNNAAKLPVGQDRVNKANEAIRDCKYGMLMKQGSDAEAENRQGQALAYYRVAQKEKDTEEVRKAIARCGG